MVAALSAVLLVAGCAGDGGSSTAEPDEGGNGEVTADNLYALPEGFADHILIEAGPVPLDGSWLGRQFLVLKDTIEDLSDGQMTVELSTGYAVHGATDVTNSLRDGVVKMAPLSPTYEPAGWDNYVWFTTAMSKPITSSRPVLSDLAANAASLEQAYNDPYLAAEYERQGVVPLLPRILMHAGYHLLCTKEVTSLEQAAGTLVRTGGPNWVSEAEAVGLTPVALPPAEMFEGLQRGVVDCIMTAIRDWAGFDLFAVANHLTVDDGAAFVGFPTALGANPAWWDSLPPGAQNIVWTAVYEYAAEIGTSRVNGDRESLTSISGSEDHFLRPMQDDMRDALLEFQSTKVDDMLLNVPPGADPAVLAAEVDFMAESFESWMEYLEADAELSGYPATWPEFAAAAADLEEIVAPAWKERLWEEIFLPLMPHPGN